MGIRGWIDMEPKGCESVGCWTQVVTLNFDLTHDLDLGFPRSNFDSHILRMGRSIDLEWKRCDWDTMLDAQWASSFLGHSAWQIQWPSNGSMCNSYSFQPVGPWMGYSFTDLGAEGCCRSLNTLFKIRMRPIQHFHQIWIVITSMKNLLMKCAFWWGLNKLCLS